MHTHALTHTHTQITDGWGRQKKPKSDCRHSKTAVVLPFHTQHRAVRTSFTSFHPKIQAHREARVIWIFHGWTERGCESCFLSLKGMWKAGGLQPNQQALQESQRPRIRRLRHTFTGLASNPQLHGGSPAASLLKHYGTCLHVAHTLERAVTLCGPSINSHS